VKLRLQYKDSLFRKRENVGDVVSPVVKRRTVHNLNMIAIILNRTSADGVASQATQLPSSGRIRKMQTEDLYDCERS
jgi:hypothetical protein